MVNIAIEPPESSSDIYLDYADGNMIVTIFEQPDYYSAQICKLFLPKMVVDRILLEIFKERTDDLIKEEENNV